MTDKDSSIVKELTGSLTGAVKGVSNVLSLGLDKGQINEVAKGILTIGAGLGAAVLTAKSTNKSAGDAITGSVGKLVTAAADAFITATKPPVKDDQKPANTGTTPATDQKKDNTGGTPQDRNSD